MRVDGLIQAAGSGLRLGLGPKAFVCLGGRTLLENAVEQLASVVDAIIVAVPQADLSRAAALVAGPTVRVIAGAATRSATTRLLIAEATAPFVVLHDVVHPFASRGLIDRLVAEARKAGAAAPGLASTEFIYDRAGNLLHAPGDVMVGQKPVVFARAAALTGYAAGEDAAADPSLLEVLARGGVHTRFVPGEATNIKITTPGDLRLAEAQMALAGTLGRDA